MLVVIGSTNPVKLKAVKKAFRKVWPKRKWVFKSLKVNSGVSSQPKCDKETVEGAKNRAINAMLKLNADFGVGIEGGLEKVSGEWFTRGWCVVVNKNQELGIGSSLSIHVPTIMMKHILKGHELGFVDDLITKRKNTKKKEGHFGIMTRLHLTRESAYTDAVISALSRFLNPQFYSKSAKTSSKNLRIKRYQ